MATELARPAQPRLRRPSLRCRASQESRLLATHRAVLEVLEDGAPVTEVARRYGVARQTVHEWLARYASGDSGGWRTGRRGRRGARTRCPRWWRRGSLACGSTRGGAIANPLGAGAGRGDAAAGPAGGLPGPDTARPGRPEEAQAQAGRLPPAGARPGDAAMADGRDGPHSARTGGSGFSRRGRHPRPAHRPGRRPRSRDHGRRRHPQPLPHRAGHRPPAANHPRRRADPVPERRMRRRSGPARPAARRRRTLGALPGRRSEAAGWSLHQG
jgi:hypothetical protein